MRVLLDWNVLGASVRVRVPTGGSTVVEGCARGLVVSVCYRGGRYDFLVRVIDLIRFLFRGCRLCWIEPNRGRISVRHRFSPNFSTALGGHRSKPTIRQVLLDVC